MLGVERRNSIDVACASRNRAADAAVTVRPMPRPSALMRSGAIGLSVGLFAFVLFERWFQIPLPKGFIERTLGF